ncbi:MAG: alpha/beta hydrolase family protein [Brevundimonas sp.]
MVRSLHRLVWAVLALLCLASTSFAQSRPLQIDDIVTLEGFGRASIAPDGAWAVYEKRGAYDTTPRFDFGGRSTWAITDLWLVDLKSPAAPPERLLPNEPVGLLRGAWSPSGTRMLVYRFRDARLQIGIVTLADRSVDWTGLTPDMPLTGAAAQWISDDEVALTIRPDGSLPAILRYYGGSQIRATQAWERTATGREPSRTVVETKGGVVTAETPDPAQVLIVLDLRTRRRRMLAEGRIADFSVSPDARRIAVILGGKRMAIRPDSIVQAEGSTRQRLAIVNLADDAVVRPMGTFDVAPHLLRWSADSSSLLVWAREDGADWVDGQLMRVDQAGTATVPIEGLTPGGGAEVLRGVRAEWLGGTPVVYARPEAGERFDWYAVATGKRPAALTGALTSVPSHIAAVTADTLFLIADGGLWAAESTGLRRLGSPDLSVAEVVISDIEKAFRLKVNDAPRQDWVAALGQGGESLVLTGIGAVRRIGPGDGTETRVVAVSTEMSLVLDRVELVETLRLRTPAGVYDLDRVNAGLAEVVLTKPVAVDHPDAWGRPTRSWLFLPQMSGSETIKGLVVQVYPGSVDSGEWSGPQTLTYGLRAVVMAGAGYAVLTPSIPIGEEGMTAIDFYVRSVDAAVDAALAAYPGLPRDRIAIQGHSFGGYTALAIATRSTRYQSYIASSGMSDWFGEWGEFIPATRLMPEDGFMMVNQQGYVEVGQGELGGPPWVNPEAYTERSPYLAADRITAPIMLITADRDFIPMSQSERMFSALYRRGGTARLVTYWGEHHHVLSPANMRDLYGQVFDWLERTLPGPSIIGPQAAGVAPMPGPSPQTPQPQ